MATGPKGQKRPAEVIGNAVRVMRIATGEEPDDVQDVRQERLRQRTWLEGREKKRAAMDSSKRLRSLL